jgi:hypothetical protein
MAQGKLVNITVNGKTVTLEEGVNSFQNIVAAAARVGAAPVTATKAVATTQPTQPAVLNPNGSYTIMGGEVFTLA